MLLCRYRFEGAAGVRMAEAPPYKNLGVCGTNYPGWLRLPDNVSSVLTIPYGAPPVSATTCFASGAQRTYSPGWSCGVSGCSGTYTPEGWSKPCTSPTPVKVCACSYDGGASTTYTYRLPRPPECTSSSSAYVRHAPTPTQPPIWTRPRPTICALHTHHVAPTAHLAHSLDVWSLTSMLRYRRHTAAILSHRHHSHLCPQSHLHSQRIPRVLRPLRHRPHHQRLDRHRHHTRRRHQPRHRPPALSSPAASPLATLIAHRPGPQRTCRRHGATWAATQASLACAPTATRRSRSVLPLCGCRSPVSGTCGPRSRDPPMTCARGYTLAAVGSLLSLPAWACAARRILAGSSGLIQRPESHLQTAPSAFRTGQPHVPSRSTCVSVLAPLTVTRAFAMCTTSPLRH